MRSTRRLRWAAIPLVLMLLLVACDIASKADNDFSASAAGGFLLVVDERAVHVVLPDPMRVEPFSSLGAGDAWVPIDESLAPVVIGFEPGDVVVSLQVFNREGAFDSMAVQGYLQASAPPSFATMAVLPSGDVVIPLSPDWEGNDDPTIQFDAYLSLLPRGAQGSSADPSLLDDCGLPYLFRTAKTLFVFCNHSQDVRIGQITPSAVQLSPIPVRPSFTENVARDVNDNPYPLHLVASAVTIGGDLLLLTRDGQYNLIHPDGTFGSVGQIGLFPNEWLADGVVTVAGDRVIVGIGSLSNRLTHGETNATKLGFMPRLDSELDDRVALSSPITSLAVSSTGELYAIAQEGKGHPAFVALVQESGDLIRINGEIGNLAVLRG